MSQIYNDSIVTKRRKGTPDDPFIPITETVQVNLNSKLQLTEFPSRSTKITIPNLYEVQVIDPIAGLAANQFYVDYDEGLILVHTSKNGTNLTITYSGTGIHYIPASRIYTKTNNAGEVTQSIQDIIDTGITTWKFIGDYDNTMSYKVNNSVRYNSESYICIKDATGVSPLNNSYWTKTAASGAIASIASTTADIVVANPTTAPALTLNTGFGANQIAKRNANGHLADTVNAPVNQNDTYVIGNDGDMGIISVKIGVEFAIVIAYPQTGTGDGVGYLLLNSSTNLKGNTTGTNGWGITKDATNKYVVKRLGANTTATSMVVAKLLT